MPSAATKPLSPAELAKLEHAFAADPASEAYHPLAEAYLAMGRFIEAMVVCKKGVKAHPTLADPRVLLARVYAGQGKDKKALEELRGALEVAPNDTETLRLMGALHLKGGEVEAGRAALLRAYELDPADAETLQVMDQHGVSVPRAPAPVPAPAFTPAPAAGPVPASVFAPAPVRAVTPPPPDYGASPPLDAALVEALPMEAMGRDGLEPSASPSAPAPRVAPQRPRPSQPRPRPSSDQPRASQPRPAVFEEPEEEVAPRKHPSRSRGRTFFFLLIFAVPLGAAGYYGWGQYRATLVREANKQLRDATEKVKTDTYAAYRAAISAAETALSLDASADTNRNARGLLAYAYTVQWGEHQHDDANREAALKNIRVGTEAKEASSTLHAADALFDYYDGKGEQGLKKIEERIRAAEADKRQVSLYYLTRGLIQTNTGDLEDAKESLERAQGISPDDPRVFVALGNLHRRRGSDIQALQAFNNALKYSRNSHPDALLGTANLILDQENPGRGFITAAKYVKTMLEMEPPPSPRQLAQAHFVRALLVSRVSSELPLYEKESFKKEVEEGTGVPMDKDRAAREIQQEENQGLALDRNNAELLLVRGRRLAWAGRGDEAAQELRKAIEMNSSAAHHHVELAKVLMRKEGGDRDAEEALRKALSMVQNSPKLLSMLGQVQYRQRKMTEAQATLEKAVGDERQRNPEARLLLGKVYRDERKDFERAVKLLDRAALEYLSDPTQAAAAYDELALTYDMRGKDGDRDKARANYEKALNADKEYAPAYCHFAKSLSRHGGDREREKVKALASESLKLEPQGPCASDMQRLKEG